MNRSLSVILLVIISSISISFVFAFCLIAKEGVEKSIDGSFQKRYANVLSIISSTVRNDILIGDGREIYLKCNAFMEYEALLSLKIVDGNGNSLCDLRKRGADDCIILNDDIRFKKDDSAEVAAIVTAEFSQDLTRSIFEKLSNSILIYIVLCVCTINIVIYVAIRFVCGPLNKLTSLFESGKIEDIDKIKLTRFSGRISEIFNLYNGTKILVDKIVHYQEQLIDSVKHKAISQTTQILAHDVRKPFSMMEALLNLFKSMDDPWKIKELSEKYISHVLQALASVNGMIQDVMEMGKETRLNQEPISPQSLIEASLYEACNMEEGSSGISIAYSFNHSSMVNIDSLKVQRVFSNIILNAIQASKGKRSLWFYTKESNSDAYLEFCIGNSGSSIAEEDLPMLFDAFYTKKKIGGTGLGLAIAYKIITAHGGIIRCESSTSKNIVQFIFTLPAAKNIKDSRNYDLPKNTDEVLAAFLTAGKNKNEEYVIGGINDPRVNDCERKIENFIKKYQRKLTIVILDDDALYRCSLKDIIDKTSSLKNLLNLKMFDDAGSALEYFKYNTPEFFICDIDLGPESINGLELLSILSKRNQIIPTCVHSNRTLLEDIELAIKYNARSFVTKPMMRAHLLKYISDFLPDDQSRYHPEENNKNPPSPSIRLYRDHERNF